VSIKIPLVARDNKAQGGIFDQDMTANLDRTGFERKFKRNAVDRYATINSRPTLHLQKDFARKLRATRRTDRQKKMRSGDTSSVLKILLRPQISAND
jgi:hypothetical protein